MVLQKSIQTSALAGISARIALTVSSATNIMVEYNGVEILASTAVTDSYSFDYTPTESAGILSLWTDEPTDALGDELYVFENWIVSLNIQAVAPNTFTFVDFIGQEHSMTNVLLPEPSILNTYQLEFTTSGAYSGNGLEYYIGGDLTGSVSSDGNHSFDINPTGFDNSVEFYAAGNDFLGVLSNISLKQKVVGELTGTISMNSRIPNYHTPYNNGACTIGFRDDVQGWLSMYSFTPESMVQLDDDVYSFKNARTYKHNADNDSQFYGTSYPSVLGFRVVSAAGVVKIAEYLSVESNVKPDYIHIQAKNPYTQATDLCPNDLVYIEGTYFASLFKDKLSPNIIDASESAKFQKALLDGDDLRAKYFDVFFIFNNTDAFEMLAVNFGLSVSTGHKK